MFKIFAILCATIGGDRQCQEYTYKGAEFADKPACEAQLKAVSDQYSVALYTGLLRSAIIAGATDPAEARLTVGFECRERPKGEEAI